MLVRLKDAKNNELLKILEDGVTPSHKRKGQLHEVYEGTFDLKLIRSYKFVKQKLDYMHANPVSKKWCLADGPAEYPHSSAKFYMTGIPGIYKVLHTNEWIAEHWVNPENISQAK